MSHSESWLVLFPFCPLLMLKSSPDQMPSLLGLPGIPISSHTFCLAPMTTARCLRDLQAAVLIGCGFQIDVGGWGWGVLHETTSSWTATMVSYSVFPMPAILARRRCSFIQQICTEHLQGGRHCSHDGFYSREYTGPKPCPHCHSSGNLQVVQSMTE